MISSARIATAHVCDYVLRVCTRVAQIKTNSYPDRRANLFARIFFFKLKKHDIDHNRVTGCHINVVMP